MEDNFNSSEYNPKAKNLIVAGKRQARKSCSYISSMSTDVIVMNDDPANWPADVNKNATDCLTKTPPNIPCKGFPKNRKGLCFSKFFCKRKRPNGESVERPWL